MQRLILVLAFVTQWYFCPVVNAQLRGEKREILKVTDRVYCAVGYALGNAMFVVTNSSVVVIDTTESPAAGREILTELRKITVLPIRHIVYTHFHGDHINGAFAFREKPNEPLTVIAQQNHIPELLKYQRTRLYNTRLNAIQFGTNLAERNPTLELANDPLRPAIGYIRPSVFFDSEYSFEEGGVRFELEHLSGETSDHLMVWLPSERVLFCGDLYYASFPMLSSPMKHDRPVLEWAESIDRMRALSAEHLVPSHTKPLTGKAQIETVLTNYAAAIRHIHDETIKCINDGLSVQEARQRVKLPDELASLPYLAELYGRVSWSVAGIYRQYSGWYDQVPANLNPLPKKEVYQALVAAAGGVEAIYQQANKAHHNGNAQLALELLTIVFDDEPGHRESLALAVKVLKHLAAQSVNGVERNIYLTAAQEYQKAAGPGSE